MRTRTIAVLLVIVTSMLPAASVRAEPLLQLPTTGERRAADMASWGTALSSVAFDTAKAWRSPDRAHALEMEGARVGITYAAVFAAKLLVRRARPCAPSCGSDNPNFSFFSGHTAIACQAMGGIRPGMGVSLCVSTGALRVAAGKHWATDTMVGAAVGSLISRLR